MQFCRRRRRLLTQFLVCCHEKQFFCFFTGVFFSFLFLFLTIGFCTSLYANRDCKRGLIIWRKRKRERERKDSKKEKFECLKNVFFVCVSSLFVVCRRINGEESLQTNRLKGITKVNIGDHFFFFWNGGDSKKLFFYNKKGK